MERLEIEIWVKPTKRLEFKQTLDDLNEKIQKCCTSIRITESDNSLSYSIFAQWETAVDMREALKIEEFEILSGAITALCEKVQIRLNDKIVGNNISMLANIKKLNVKA